MGMRDFALTIEEVRSLRALHRSCRDRRLADRIKAIVLLGTGWTVSDTGEALMLDEQTVREYVQLYRRGTDKSLKSNTGHKAWMTDIPYQAIVKHVRDRRNAAHKV
jgi:hypothetical protein